jgi:hypothetical protein
MSEEYVDPSGNTEQFRVFAQRTDPAPEPAGRSRLLVIGVVAAVIVVLAVVAMLAV